MFQYLICKSMAYYERNTCNDAKQLDWQNMTSQHPQFHLKETVSLMDRQRSGWPRQMSALIIDNNYYNNYYIFVTSLQLNCYRDARKVACRLPAVFETRVCFETSRNRLVWMCLEDVFIMIIFIKCHCKNNLNFENINKTSFHHFRYKKQHPSWDANWLNFFVSVYLKRLIYKLLG